jgi:hypothetical protein
MSTNAGPFLDLLYYFSAEVVRVLVSENATYEPLFDLLCYLV